MMRVGRQKTGYLPSLDGWRAVAIVGVILTHDSEWSLAGFSNRSWKGYGGWGVQVFFAISGFLICTRVLQEEALLGRFKLGSFYIRRFFRIQPAAMTYLALIALLMVAHVVHEHWHFWFGALLLYQNFLFHQQNRALIFAGYFTGHFWTLALEEQFYVLLSLFLFFVRRRRIAVLFLLLAALKLLQHMAKVHGLYSEDTSARKTFWAIQFLFYPAMLALLLRVEWILSAAKRYLRPWVAYVGTVLLLVGHYVVVHGRPGLWSRWMFNVESGYLLQMLGLWIVATVLHRESWSTRLLEWSPLRYIGRLSYSIYLWHLLFLCTGEPETRVTWAPLVFLGQRPFRYFAIFGFAMLSYYFIEKPCIRLGHRLAPPATPGHADLAVSAAAPIASAV